MGLLDSLAGKSQEVVDYWTCKVPYFIDMDWPIKGAPKKYVWIDSHEIKMAGVCGVAGWYIRMWGDQMPGTVYTGNYYRNEKTGEEMWTVSTPAGGGSWGYEKMPLEELLLVWGDNIELVDPPAGTVTSGGEDDEDYPSYGVPPGLETTPVTDPSSPNGGYKSISGGTVEVPKPVAVGEVTKAGFPWWLAILGVGAVAGGTYFLSKRKAKGKAKKAYTKKSMYKGKGKTRRPAYEM